MKKLTFCILCLLSSTAYADLLGLSNPADIAGKQGWSVYSSAQYLVATDFTSAKAFNGNWNRSYSPRNNTNLAIGITQLETGVSYDSWRLAGFYRQEQLIEANRDSLDLVYYNKQKLTMPAGRSFNTNLRIEGFEAQGLRLDKGFAFDFNENVSLSFGSGISLLRGTRVRLANANANVTATATGYTYNATVEDSNSRASYPFAAFPITQPGTPLGDGYALNLGAKVLWAKGARLDFAVNDLFGQITWRNMPHTIEIANSAVIARDAAGNIYYNPTLNGANDLNRRTIVQKLTTKAHTRFTYPVSDFNFFVGTSWMIGYWLPELGATYRIDEHWKASFDYDTRFKSIELGIQHPYGRLSARSSSATLSNAHAYGMNAEIRIPF